MPISPCGSGEASEHQPFLFGAHLGDTGRLHALTDPVALLQRVNEHELDTNVVAVRLFETVQDFSETLSLGEQQVGFAYRYGRSSVPNAAVRTARCLKSVPSALTTLTARHCLKGTCPDFGTWLEMLNGLIFF